MTDIRLGGALPDTPLRLRLKELREARGLTIGQLASLTGFHVATLNRIERGGGRPSARDIERLAKALGVRPEELVEGTPPP
jgi:transcriptional regulator with XRE-family HTH domain